MNEDQCVIGVESVVSSSVWPHRWQPTGLLCPWDSPGKDTGVDCHFLLQCMKVKSLSHVRLLATPWTTAYQAPLSMGFSRQEYWSGLPLPQPPKIKSVTVSTVSPSTCHEVMGLDAMILVFWMLSFKPTFSLSSFTFIQRLFSSTVFQNPYRNYVNIL